MLPLNILVKLLAPVKVYEYVRLGTFSISPREKEKRGLSTETGECSETNDRRARTSLMSGSKPG